jgi:hypothetical protein
MWAQRLGGPGRQAADLAGHTPLRPAVHPAACAAAHLSSTHHCWRRCHRHCARCAPAAAVLWWLVRQRRGLMYAVARHALSVCHALLVLMQHGAPPPLRRLVCCCSRLMLPAL